MVVEIPQMLLLSRTTRMQRAKFRFQKASEGIEVSVLAVNQSRGFILLNMTKGHYRGVTLTDARFFWGRNKVPSRVQGSQ